MALRRMLGTTAAFVKPRAWPHIQKAADGIYKAPSVCLRAPEPTETLAEPDVGDSSV